MKVLRLCGLSALLAASSLFCVRADTLLSDGDLPRISADASVDSELAAIDFMNTSIETEAGDTGASLSLSTLSIRDRMPLTGFNISRLSLLNLKCREARMLHSAEKAKIEADALLEQLKDELDIIEQQAEVLPTLDAQQLGQLFDAFFIMINIFRSYKALAVAAEGDLNGERYSDEYVKKVVLSCYRSLTHFHEAIYAKTHFGREFQRLVWLTAFEPNELDDVQERNREHEVKADQDKVTIEYLKLTRFLMGVSKFYRSIEPNKKALEEGKGDRDTWISVLNNITDWISEEVEGLYERFLPHLKCMAEEVGGIPCSEQPGPPPATKGGWFW